MAKKTFFEEVVGLTNPNISQATRRAEFEDIP